jgi:sugar/nucleoside kinase (ribokinase family)
MVDITLTIDEQTLSLGMEYAREHNIPFNMLVMKSIEDAVKSVSRQWWQETLQLMDQAHGNSHGKKWVREELYRG